MYEFINNGLSGIIASLLTWYLTMKHYKKQIADQIYTGPVLNNIYKPLIEEYKRVHYENISGGHSVLNTKLIINIIRSNNVLLNTVPTRIRHQLEYIERLCLSNTDLNKFDEKSDKILLELNELNIELAKMYKEFVNE